MARSMRFALLILPLLVTMSCRFVDQQKDLLARVAFSVLRPVLEMQSSKATLTQGSVRNADAVAPKQATRLTASVMATARPAAQPAPRVVDVTGAQAVAVQMASERTIVVPLEAMESAKAMYVKMDAEAVIAKARAKARENMASAECALKEQSRRERLLARKRLIVVTPTTFQWPVLAPPVGG